MAHEKEESLFRTVLRGAAWGIGFTAAVGGARWVWQKITADEEDDDDDVYPEFQKEEE